MKRSAALAVLVGLLSGPAAVAAPLAEGEKLLASGEYAKAEAVFRGLLRSAQRGAAALGLARAQLVTGRYAAAIKTARGAARGEEQDRALTLVGEAQRAAGDLAAAALTLEQVTQKSPGAYRALMQLALVYLEQGKAAQARAVFDRFYDDYASGKIDKRSAEELTYVAMSCRYTDNFRDAHDTLRDALAVDAQHVEAYLELAEISLEKYEEGHAEAHYGRVLERNPHHLRALVGLARVKLEQSNDVDAALALLARAEQVDPQAPEIGVLRGEIHVDAEQYDLAEKALERVLKRNPRHLEALSMLAANAFMKDDVGAFRKLRDRVLQLNPGYTAFFRAVVKVAVRHHRYGEAIDIGKQAIKIDPRDWYSLADLGTNYLRLGEEQEGLKYLRAAWKGDQFNVRNYNLLNLYDDVVSKEYTFITTKHFKLRVHLSEVELIRRTVGPVLERAYAVYARKYKFTPKLPVVVELFRDKQHYAVRTVGVPGLSALGVCFGRVITAISPTAGEFNWGQVLWHELNHVFTIQMSRSRIPRWLTEGLADMEPELHRSEWRREQAFDIYHALQSGRLKGLAAMKTAFSRARSMDEMVVAYYQGSLLARYIIERWGMNRMLAIVRAYAAGKQTEEILPAQTGVAIARLDGDFRAKVEQQLGRYRSSWYAHPDDYRDLDQRRKAAAARPDDAAAQAALAAALLVAGKGAEVEQVARRALALDGSNRLALWTLSQLARSQKKNEEARELLGKLVAAGGDGFHARLVLGRLALAAGDQAAAEKHLTAASGHDPERAEPWALLVQMFEKQGKPDRVVGALERLALLDQQQLGPVAKLVNLLAKRGDHAGVRRYGTLAYYISPASATLHVLLADAYAAPAPRAELRRAIWHLELALLCEPDKPADLHEKLARLHLRRGDRSSARKAVKSALEADPKHAGAMKLQGELP